MSERSTPKETLQHYFDELLSGEELLSKSQVSTAAASSPQYADPDTERQQKLSRLLQTAQPQLLVAEQVVSAVVAEEIQEWDLEPVALQVTSELPTVDLPEPEFSAADGDTLEDELPDLELAPGYQMDGLEWLENGRPVWAQTRFDVLLFRVSGLTLAVPLVSLGQIQPLTDELTPLFGQADWFMGLQPTPAGKIRTVNTAKFVMPERYDAAFVETAKYVVSINGVPWGLAVDSVNQPISLEPEDVKWRGERSKRPWLAGTVKAHMCALLDIPRIGQMLMDADRNTGKQLGYQ
jgi:purine-binding chemotaxis protein CheW